VNGTGVNGSGMLTCAANAVSAVTTSMAHARSTARNADELASIVKASTSVTAPADDGEVNIAADINVCVPL